MLCAERANSTRMRADSKTDLNASGVAAEHIGRGLDLAVGYGLGTVLGAAPAKGIMVVPAHRVAEVE